jgi:beta-phosphoglucomutase-like phosphatase (HAD superfamily)
VKNQRINRPRLFIGSSKESLYLANAAHSNLDEDAEVTIWNHGIFKLSSFNLENLLNELGNCDYGLFVFSPDDVAKIRGEKRRIVRDNVILELGLFLGRLGRKRSFILMPRGVKHFRIPTDLSGLVLAEYNHDRHDRNWRSALGPACEKIRELLQGYTRSPESTPALGLKLDSRDEFTKLLVSRLADDKVSTIHMITYTGEVDGHLLDRYRIHGQKKIFIYKRSILSDLAEQQECNICRIAADSVVKRWHKRNISISTSELYDEQIPPGSSITQFLYDCPPSKRVYMFDGTEAIIAYYEVLCDPAQEPGSVYKGMVESGALHLTDKTPIGKFLLDEIKHYIAGLQRISRTWDEEREILLNRGAWKGAGKKPCVRPRAVFLDLDGILYDSISLYETAWTEAFALENIDYPVEKVYLQEGRRGTEIIRMHYNEMGINVADDIVARIKVKKDEVLARIGPPKPQAGAKELIRAISNSGLDIWVVTGSADKRFIKRLSGVFGSMISEDNVITGQSVKAGKPSPDPYLLACYLAEVHPHEAIVIENAPLGIQSADSAGTFCIAVNTGPLANSDLKNVGARAVFDSCSTIATHWDEIISVLRK